MIEGFSEEWSLEQSLFNLKMYYENKVMAKQRKSQ